jgi:hypothetical protein
MTEGASVVVADLAVIAQEPIGRMGHGGQTA